MRSRSTINQLSRHKIEFKHVSKTYWSGGNGPEALQQLWRLPEDSGPHLRHLYSHSSSSRNSHAVYARALNVYKTVVATARAKSCQLDQNLVLGQVKCLLGCEHCYLWQQYIHCSILWDLVWGHQEQNRAAVCSTLTIVSCSEPTPEQCCRCFILNEHPTIPSS